MCRGNSRTYAKDYNWNKLKIVCKIISNQLFLKNTKQSIHHFLDMVSYVLSFLGTINLCLSKASSTYNFITMACLSN